MRKTAGLLVYRKQGSLTEVFLVHPGGPFWKGKEAGAWSIPKGEFDETEEPLSAAKREFNEETGQEIEGDFIELLPVRQKSGKLVFAWAVQGNVDAESIMSNTIEIEYPYKSGKRIIVPEVDRAAWFSIPVAREKINAAQVQLLEQLLQILPAE